MFWWVIGITLVLWIYGIASARKRGISRKLQLLFTIVMLGGAVGDFLFEKGNIPTIRIAATFSIAIWSAVLAFGVVAFLKKRLFIACGLFAIGISLIYFSFFASEFLFVPLFVVGFVLLIASVAPDFRRRKRRAPQGGSLEG